MPGEYLPPVVTKLEGEIGDLIAKLAEAKALLKTFNEDVERQSAQSGRRSGAGLMSEFHRALTEARQGVGGEFGRVVGDFEKLAGDAGNRSGKSFVGSLLDWFKSAGSVFKQIGQGLGEQFSGGFAGVLKGIFSNPATAVIGGGIAAFLVSEVVAGLSGIGTATVGLGGITAGIVGAIHDPAIKQAFSELGADAGVVFHNATGSFINPLDHALASLDDFIKSSGPEFAKVFEPLAKFVQPLVQGFQNFITGVLPGLQDGMAKAGPLVQVLAQELPEVGKALGDFFEKMSASEGGNKAGLIAIIDLIDSMIRGFGNVLEVGSHVFAGLIDAIHPVAIALDDTIGAEHRLLDPPGVTLGDQMHNARLEVDKLYDAMHQAKDATDQATGPVNALTKALDAQKAAVDGLTGAWNTWFGLSMTVEQANLAVKTGMMDLTDSIKQNGKTFDENTRAGAANYNMLITEIGNLQAQYTAETNAGMSTKQATELFQGQYDQLIKNAQQSGLTADQVARLNAEFGQLLNTLNSLNNIPPPTPGGFSMLPYMASGGFVGPGGIIRAAQGLLPPRSPGTLVLAGEPQTGGEVMIPQRGISQARAAALGMVAMQPYGMTVAPAGGGDAPPIVVQFVVDGQVFFEKVVMPAALKSKRQYGSLGL